ncbi:MAG: hypothetical protein AB7N76_00400 [Planctomycetota bacterium]
MSITYEVAEPTRFTLTLTPTDNARRCPNLTLYLIASVYRGAGQDQADRKQFGLRWSVGRHGLPFPSESCDESQVQFGGPEPLQVRFGVRPQRKGGQGATPARVVIEVRYFGTRTHGDQELETRAEAALRSAGKSVELGRHTPAELPSFTAHVAPGISDEHRVDVLVSGRREQADSARWSDLAQVQVAAASGAWVVGPHRVVDDAWPVQAVNVELVPFPDGHVMRTQVPIAGSPRLQRLQPGGALEPETGSLLLRFPEEALDAKLAPPAGGHSLPATFAQTRVGLGSLSPAERGAPEDYAGWDQERLDRELNSAWREGEPGQPAKTPFFFWYATSAVDAVRTRAEDGRAPVVRLTERLTDFGDLAAELGGVDELLEAPAHDQEAARFVALTRVADPLLSAASDVEDAVTRERSLLRLGAQLDAWRRQLDGRWRQVERGALEDVARLEELRWVGARAQALGELWRYYAGEPTPLVESGGRYDTGRVAFGAAQEVGTSRASHVLVLPAEERGAGWRRIEEQRPTGAVSVLETTLTFDCGDPITHRRWRRGFTRPEDQPTELRHALLPVPRLRALLLRERPASDAFADHLPGFVEFAEVLLECQESPDLDPALSSPAWSDPHDPHTGATRWSWLLGRLFAPAHMRRALRELEVATAPHALGRGAFPQDVLQAHLEAQAAALRLRAVACGAQAARLTPRGLEVERAGCARVIELQARERAELQAASAATARDRYGQALDALEARRQRAADALAAQRREVERCEEVYARAREAILGNWTPGEPEDVAARLLPERLAQVWERELIPGLARLPLELRSQGAPVRITAIAAKQVVLGGRTALRYDREAFLRHAQDWLRELDAEERRALWPRLGGAEELEVELDGHWWRYASDTEAATFRDEGGATQRWTSLRRLHAAAIPAGALGRAVADPRGPGTLARLVRERVSAFSADPLGAATFDLGLRREARRLCVRATSESQDGLREALTASARWLVEAGGAGEPRAAALERLFELLRDQPGACLPVGPDELWRSRAGSGAWVELERRRYLRLGAPVPAGFEDRGEVQAVEATVRWDTGAGAACWLGPDDLDALRCVALWRLREAAEHAWGPDGGQERWWRLIEGLWNEVVVPERVEQVVAWELRREPRTGALRHLPWTLTAIDPAGVKTLSRSDGEGTLALSRDDLLARRVRMRVAAGEWERIWERELTAEHVGQRRFVDRWGTWDLRSVEALRVTVEAHGERADLTLEELQQRYAGEKTLTRPLTWQDVVRAWLPLDLEELWFGELVPENAEQRRLLIDGVEWVFSGHAADGSRELDRYPAGPCRDPARTKRTLTKQQADELHARGALRLLYDLPRWSVRDIVSFNRDLVAKHGEGGIPVGTVLRIPRDPPRPAQLVWGAALRLKATLTLDDELEGVTREQLRERARGKRDASAAEQAGELWPHLPRSLLAFAFFQSSGCGEDADRDRGRFLDDASRIGFGFKKLYPRASKRQDGSYRAELQGDPESVLRQGYMLDDFYAAQEEAAGKDAYAVDWTASYAPGGRTVELEFDLFLADYQQPEPSHQVIERARVLREVQLWDDQGPIPLEDGPPAPGCKKVLVPKPGGDGRTWEERAVATVERDFVASWLQVGVLLYDERLSRSLRGYQVPVEQAWLDVLKDPTKDVEGTPGPGKVDGAEGLGQAIHGLWWPYFRLLSGKLYGPLLYGDVEGEPPTPPREHGETIADYEARIAAARARRERLQEVAAKDLSQSLRTADMTPTMLRKQWDAAMGLFRACVAELGDQDENPHDGVAHSWLRLAVRGPDGWPVRIVPAPLAHRLGLTQRRGAEPFGAYFQGQDVFHRVWLQELDRRLAEATQEEVQATKRRDELEEAKARRERRKKVLAAEKGLHAWLEAQPEDEPEYDSKLKLKLKVGRLAFELSSKVELLRNLVRPEWFLLANPLFASLLRLIDPEGALRERMGLSEDPAAESEVLMRLFTCLLHGETEEGGATYELPTEPEKEVKEEEVRPGVQKGKAKGPQRPKLELGWLYDLDAFEHQFFLRLKWTLLKYEKAAYLGPFYGIYLRLKFVFEVVLTVYLGFTLRREADHERYLRKLVYKNEALAFGSKPGARLDTFPAGRKRRMVISCKTEAQAAELERMVLRGVLDLLAKERREQGGAERLQAALKPLEDALRNLVVPDYHLDATRTPPAEEVEAPGSHYEVADQPTALVPGQRQLPERAAELLGAVERFAADPEERRRQVARLARTQARGAQFFDPQSRLRYLIVREEQHAALQALLPEGRAWRFHHVRAFGAAGLSHRAVNRDADLGSGLYLSGSVTATPSFSAALLPATGKAIDQAGSQAPGPLAEFMRLAKLEVGIAGKFPFKVSMDTRSGWRVDMKLSWALACSVAAGPVEAELELVPPTEIWKDHVGGDQTKELPAEDGWVSPDDLEAEEG